MAKRKRLTPAQPGYLVGAAAPETKSGFPGATPALSPAPIAQVAGEASASAALTELSTALQMARAEGRMIEQLPLDAIDAGHLMRDRMVQDEDEMEALLASLRARGQQTPVEVLALPHPRGGHTHGLISGWRRLTALRRLQAETGEDRFATVKALVTAPDTAQAAYVAMVEENEIRVNLSLYERARIALGTVQQGVYPTVRAALQGLYGATTRSKRSKIGSFVPLVEALDGQLRFGPAIPEKLGLALSRALTDVPDFGSKVQNRLLESSPETAADEIALLTAVLEGPAGSAPRPTGVGRAKPGKAAPVSKSKPSDLTRYDIASGLVLTYSGSEQRIELCGDQVDAGLCQALRDWLGRR